MGARAIRRIKVSLAVAGIFVISAGLLHCSRSQGDGQPSPKPQNRVEEGTIEDVPPPPDDAAEAAVPRVPPPSKRLWSYYH